ncbi:unnamed protein product [Linum trigynum]|uniref:Uncharacterized protein n=1 Tax=Linum trigynum TaxID=586398 RepID=A0AAV2EBX2_9ROSI
MALTLKKRDVNPKLKGKWLTCFMPGKAIEKGEGYLKGVKLELVNARNQLDGLKEIHLGSSSGEHSAKPNIRCVGGEQFSRVVSGAVGEFFFGKNGLGGRMICLVEHKNRYKKPSFDEGLPFNFPLQKKKEVKKCTRTCRGKLELSVIGAAQRWSAQLEAS